MKRKIAAALAVTLAFAPLQPLALACGGPEVKDISGALAPLDSLLQMLSLVPCETSDCAYFLEDMPTKNEVLFLNPFRLSRPKETADLWKISYESGGTTDAKGDYVEYQPPAPLSVETLESDLRAQAFDKAVAEAQNLFDQVMNMPVALAQNNRAAFLEALHVLEFQTVWGRPKGEGLDQHVQMRLGTLRFIALKAAMRTQIPDGYKEEIQKKMTPETWKALEALQDQWLKDFPNHPLTDLVRLAKLRLAYLQDQAPKAWQILFDVFTRRPVRAMGEMRFLLKQSMPPKLEDVPQDPVLLAALAPWFDYKDGKNWTTLWKLSEANATAPWSVNLQERLLLQEISLAQKDQPLPEGFPATNKNPTQLWGQFRLFALYKAGKYDQALAEAESLKPNASAQALQAKIYLSRREWAKVMALEKLPMDSKRYLIRVLLDDAALKTLADSPQKEIQSEARLALGVHLASQRDWNGGAALLDPVNPAQAAFWRDAAKLASDQSPAGLLAWARFLRKNDGKIFYKQDTVWYRTLFGRLSYLQYGQEHRDQVEGGDASLPWTNDQMAKRLMAHLTSLDPYLALKAYAAWLEKVGGKDPEAKAVLKEADKNYNWLVNWANNYSESWKAYLKDSPEAQTIRKVGMEAK